MSILEGILAGTKGKELRQRMERSIEASKELAAELRKTGKKIDTLVIALEAWIQKAEEIKALLRK